MDAARIFDFAVGLVEISLMSWFLIASHYKLRPSSFDFVFKRRNRMQEWKSEMYDLPQTVLCISSPFILLGHISMGIVDIIVFLPLMIAILLLHIFAAACLWMAMPFGLRPIHCTFYCLQASCGAGKVLLAESVQSFSTIYAYGRTKQLHTQYTLRRFASLESEYRSR